MKTHHADLHVHSSHSNKPTYWAMHKFNCPESYTSPQLLSHGLALEKMKLLPRWVDTELFSPKKKCLHFWEERGLPAGVKLLYVGRVSLEKSLELLVEAFRRLMAQGTAVSLAVIGDGPFKQEMEWMLAGYPAFFTGYLQGEGL
jgi:glycosyltransferase involved in cell wall biosynthesis